MQQLNFQGKTKEQEAIEFIREHEPQEGYYLGDGGGKDSCVLLHIAERSGVKYHPYFVFTGLDSPELCRFIRKYHPKTKWLRPKRSFFAEMVERRPPTRVIRWCCDFLKKDPSKHLPYPHRLMGMRMEESAKRASRPRIEYFKHYKQWIYKPLHFFEEWEIWDYIDNHKLPYCSLYDDGFDRLGCVVCPFITGREKVLEKHLEKWPKHYHAFEIAMKKYWDRGKRDRSKWRESTFEEFLSNWYRGK